MRLSKNPEWIWKRLKISIKHKIVLKHWASLCYWFETSPEGFRKLFKGPTEVFEKSAKEIVKKFWAYQEKYQRIFQAGLKIKKLRFE